MNKKEHVKEHHKKEKLYKALLQQNSVLEINC